MMIDIGSFEGFLTSLSYISRIDYQIWDKNAGMIFSTGNVPLKELPIKELEVLSNSILEREDFQYVPNGGYGYLCGMPLKNGKGLTGSLVAVVSDRDRASGSTNEPDTDTFRAKEMNNFLGYLVGLVEENIVVQEEIEEMAQELDPSFEELKFYARIATQIKTLRFSGSMLKNLIGKLLESMRSDIAFAILPNRPQYDVQVIKPDISDKFSDKKNFFDSLINKVPADAPSLDENYFVVNDSMNDPQYQNLAEQPYRFLTVKMQHNRVFYGWLGLVSFNMKEVFRQGELKLLTSMSEQLAVVIANTDLYEDLEQFIINMVKSLVFAIEAKDLYTSGHSERVSHYSMLIGRKLELTEKETNDLKWASILHDIGKIGIPERILNKTDRLTDDEFEIIKGHPAKGGKILRPVAQLAGSLSAIIHHHERYDGGGYPHGLKGEDIPLAARIIAVADTFDAINSTRAYRPARKPEEALAAIEAVAGSQLDPYIVQVFKKIYKEPHLSANNPMNF